MIYRIQPLKVLAALALLTGLGHAQTQAPSTPPTCLNLYRGEINSRFAFSEASAVALWYARKAVQEYDDSTANWERPAFSDLVAIMSITKAASENYECAVRILLPFEQSLDKQVIASGAKYGVVTYQRHLTLNETYIKRLREPDNSGGIAGAADFLSTLAVEKEKLWLDLGILAAQSTLGLVDLSYTHAKGHASGAVLKRSEREEFLKRLLGDFPELKDGTRRDKWSAPTVIASLYLDFLKQPWKCADEGPID